MKELKRRKEEDESRRRQEEIEKATPVRHPTERHEGQRSETGSIKSGKRSDGDQLEGMLIRKHEWESTTKKASNRSWDKVCVILRGTEIGFYKDVKAYRTSPEATYRGEIPIDVVGATAEIASDYKKKPHVFRLKLADCGEYLFQATSDEEMAQWVNSINQVAIQDEGAAGGAGRSQTLPEQGRKDEPKKRSFFTLKKK